MKLNNILFVNLVIYVFRPAGRPSRRGGAAKSGGPYSSRPPWPSSSPAPFSLPSLAGHELPRARTRRGRRSQTRHGRDGTGTGSLRPSKFDGRSEPASLGEYSLLEPLRSLRPSSKQTKSGSAPTGFTSHLQPNTRTRSEWLKCYFENRAMF